MLSNLRGRGGEERRGEEGGGGGGGRERREENEGGQLIKKLSKTLRQFKFIYGFSCPNFGEMEKKLNL